MTTQPVTSFLSISGAVRDALASGAQITDGPVVRGRRLVLEKRWVSGINVNSKAHAAQQLSIDAQDLQWETTVQVEVLARAGANQDAEEALDPFVQAAWQRLAQMPVPDGVFGITLDPVISIDLDEADQTVAVATLRLRITHITTGGGLSA